MNQIAKSITTAISNTLEEMDIDKKIFFTKLTKNFNEYQEYEQAVEDKVEEVSREVKQESDEFLEA